MFSTSIYGTNKKHNHKVNNNSNNNKFKIPILPQIFSSTRQLPKNESDDPSKIRMVTLNHDNNEQHHRVNGYNIMIVYILYNINTLDFSILFI